MFMEYPFAQVGSVALAFSSPTFLPTPSVLTVWPKGKTGHIQKTAQELCVLIPTSLFPGLAFQLNYNGGTMCNLECLHRWKTCAVMFTSESLYGKIAGKVQINALSYTTYADDDFILHPV